MAMAFAQFVSIERSPTGARGSANQRPFPAAGETADSGATQSSSGHSQFIAMLLPERCGGDDGV